MQHSYIHFCFNKRYYHKARNHFQDYAEGHTVFYDYLGWFMIFYTEDTGVILNITFSICAVIAILAAVFLMSRADDADTTKRVFIRFLTILVIQIITIATAVGLAMLVAVTIDGIGASECWYSEPWLIFGIYFCPIFFTMCMLPAIYIRWTKEGVGVT